MSAPRKTVLPLETCSLRLDPFQVSAEHLTNLNTVHACVGALCADSLLSRVEKNLGRRTKVNLWGYSIKLRPYQKGSILSVERVNDLC